jgi:dTDP-glucose 4,6-dehydratase
LRKLLVTGGAGFIGVNFVYHWLQQYPQASLVVLDALTYAGNKLSLDAAVKTGRIEFIHGDIRDQALIESLLQQHQIDTVVNFAAESHVDRSITGPDAFIDTNVLGTHALLKAARTVWLEKNQVKDHLFHHISTDEVFGSLDADAPAFTEDNQYEPSSPYSASKAASDHLVRAYQHTYGLNTTTSNCSNNYGPYHFPEKLIPLCITNILRGIALPIYGDGKNIRDWLFVKDHCVGIELVINKGVRGETYNIGVNNEYDNLSLVKLLCKVMDEQFEQNPELKSAFPQSPMAKSLSSESLIEFVTDRAGHDRRYAIDNRKITEQLGYSTSVNFEQGLKATVEWYLSSQSWWQPLLKRM